MAEDAHLLKLNSFNRPVVNKDGNAAYIHIVYLILLEPGKFQSHPNMGVGLRSVWRFYSGDNLESDLMEAIQNQIEQYLPELTNVDVTVEINYEHMLTIIIDTTQGIFAINYDRQKDEVKVLDNTAIALKDLL